MEFVIFCLLQGWLAAEARARDNWEPETESGREGQGYWAKIGRTGQASKTGDLYKILAER